MASKLFWILLRNPHQSQKPIQSYPKATISLNLKRRHLDTAQRAMVASRLAILEIGTNQHTEISAPSQSDAAAMLMFLQTQFNLPEKCSIKDRKN